MARINWVDRVPTKAGKWTKINETDTTVTLTRADEPTVEGTSVNAANLNQMVQFGDLSSNFSVSGMNVDLTNTTTTANTSTATPAFGGTFTAIDSITTDAKGRVTAKNTKTVTIPSVLATVLTGLSTATNAAITAADSILSAFGKLQAQITAHIGLTSTAHSATSAATGSTLMARDSNGRAQIADPSVALDIANKQYVDAAQSMVKLVSTTTASASTAINVSLPSLTGYRELKIRLYVLPESSTSDGIYMRFNGISTSNYCVSVFENGSFNAAANSVTLGAFGTASVGYHDLEITIQLNTRELHGYYIGMSRFGSTVQPNKNLFYMNYSALTPALLSTINFFTSAYNIVAGSKVDIWGIK